MKTPFPFYSLENTTRFPKKPTALFFKFCINSLWKYSNSQLLSFGLAQLCPSLLHTNAPHVYSALSAVKTISTTLQYDSSGHSEPLEVAPTGSGLGHSAKP